MGDSFMLFIILKLAHISPLLCQEPLRALDPMCGTAALIHSLLGASPQRATLTIVSSLPLLLCLLFSCAVRAFMFMKRYLSQSPSQAYFRSQATSLSDVSQTAS